MCNEKMGWICETHNSGLDSKSNLNTCDSEYENEDDAKSYAIVGRTIILTKVSTPFTLMNSLQ